MSITDIRSDDYTFITSHLFRFAPTTDRWERVDGHAPTADAPPLPGSIRVATLNILHDHRSWRERQMIVSQKRYAALPVHLEALDADVIALHDATKSALKVLQESDFIRRAYTMTAIADSVGERPFSLLLSRLPVLECHALHLSRHRDESALIPCVVLKGRPVRPGYEGKRLAAAALRSDSDAIGNEGIGERSYQLKFCTDALRALEPSGNIVLLADTNMQQTCEDASLQHADLLDVWAETHFSDGEDGRPGYTHDPGCNALLRNMNPGEKRMLRPDRILIPRGACVSPCAPASLWATEPLPVMDHQTATSMWGKLGLASKTVGLFLSNRFGVVADLKIGEAPFDGNALAAERLDMNARTPVQAPRPAEAVDAAFAVAGHAAFFAARLLGQR
uniref:Endonuclease/exonuclease/phosphatase domain-containing protein n=1 Tax=Neobodo designis TaxID=312471 RepID=A0A7S1Q7R4_NEODS|mmetsp:Transcript_34440/g.106384  ORF Transcript_34440/g.106384 Transcript_34440/m.106384 type:complete len:392 (+) Transcript_34440:45-1220(+)|eukprot:CAMPEP_0174838326 /NCGR_PEP_ID=MMETSP1114-20130205/7314_1 /TAXON_ID=312471 /ORGANISM="Neobodo designis, Strain CCAP 1951/1" /LENGTH=391 /DNA_ID=CAMNT_0016072423 /DNA_START=48 /DNA_END=1223 /DNA_ORIENTATION=+